MVRKTKEQALATKESILSAALDVFVAKGVARASLADIADAAGVTRGAIYWHFRNKVDIFEAMHDQLHQPVMEQVLKDLEKEQQIAKVEGMEQNDLINSIITSLNNMGSRINAQKASYKDLAGMMNNKEKLLAATPAIQPVSNTDLKRIASGFGYRIDPVYKTVKLHPGLDFSAPAGTPIYATADGSIEVAGNRGDGYGNCVIINHGYGYKTLYGHMFRVKARGGQRVKRGEVIGYVGSTGKSTGPHCHYEVIKNGNKIDPIYFFYNDLTPEQFDRLLKLAAASNQSFD